MLVYKSVAIKLINCHVLKVYWDTMYSVTWLLEQLIQMCTRLGQSEFTHWNKLDDTTGGNAIEVKHLSVHWPSGRTLPVVAWQAALWKVLQSPEGTFHIHTLPLSVPASRTGAQGCHSSHCGGGSREDHRHQTTPALPLKRSSATAAVQRVLGKTCQHSEILSFPHKYLQLQ